MAAYAAVISLKHTINGILANSSLNFSFSPIIQQVLETAYDETKSLQKALERLNGISRSRSSWERLDGLEGQIRECAHKLEDVLELHELESEDEQVLLQEIASFGETVKKMEKDYIEELSRDDDDDNDDDAAQNFWSNDDYGLEMVGHSTLFNSTREDLLCPLRPDAMMTIALLGKEGSGRSLLARAIFEDACNGMFPQIFDSVAWVKVGTTLEAKQVLINIISQLSSLNEADCESLKSVEVQKLCQDLWNMLCGKRYVIVLDDVDDVELVKFFLESSFPDHRNIGSVIIFTTNSDEIGEMTSVSTRIYGEFFSETASLTFHQLFYDHMPHDDERELFMDVGMKIIDNCGCSFLSFAKIVLFLLKSETTTLEQWSEIAADKGNPIFVVSDEISEISIIETEIENCKAGISEEMLLFNFLEDELENIRDSLYPKRFLPRMIIKSFFGMAGIGKTTFARKFFKDEVTCSHFNHRVWLTLGPNYKSTEILLDILSQMHPDTDKLVMKGDEELVRELCEQLSSKRCLIVFDDLCSKEPLLVLKELFPDIMGVALVTTRLGRVAKFDRDDVDVEMEFLDKEESWCLLRRKVFGGGLCPSYFEKAGRKIAERCDGLPLMILTVAEELLKVELSKEYWNDVASNKENSVFENAHHQISEGLLPSYQSLPQHLKSCFLYIGAFCEKDEISTSNLTNLLIAEGFLDPNPSQTEEEFVAECLSELIDKSVVRVQRKASDSRIKTCRLPTIFWHLSQDQVMKNQFFHAMNRYDDCSIESVMSQRRLCIRNGILLGVKDVQNSLACNASSAHSLLCVSPLQQYPVPLYFDTRLLRVMNAVTIRLYDFPTEVVGLLHLRYLGITCNGELPTSISNLQKLQYLIVKRYLSIQSSENSSFLPVEIWDMKELRHLEITGRCLPDHKHGTTGLHKLSSLLDVSAKSCREEVLKWIPNLKRLGVRIELEPDDDGRLFTYLNNIHHLHKLESLKCVVANPEISCEAFSPPAPISMFPRSLKKLSLSGLGYSWEHMNIIGELMNLEVLKLKCYAFQGEEWELKGSDQFSKLKFILVQDSDIVDWRYKKQLGMVLRGLCMKHCYNLKEIPAANHFIYLDKMQIVDSSLSTETWAEKMGECAQLVSEVSSYRSWVAKK